MWDSCGSKAPNDWDHLHLTSLLFALLFDWTLQLCLNKVQEWEHVTFTTLIRLSFYKSEQKTPPLRKPRNSLRTTVGSDPGPCSLQKVRETVKIAVSEGKLKLANCCLRNTVLICLEHTLFALRSIIHNDLPPQLHSSPLQSGKFLELYLTYLMRAGL